MVTFMLKLTRKLIEERTKRFIEPGGKIVDTYVYDDGSMGEVMTVSNHLFYKYTYVVDYDKVLVYGSLCQTMTDFTKESIEITL